MDDMEYCLFPIKSPFEKRICGGNSFLLLLVLYLIHKYLLITAKKINTER